MRKHDAAREAPADESGQIAGEIELWTLGKRPFGRGTERPPGGQSVQKGGTAGQQKADFHFQMRARDRKSTRLNSSHLKLSRMPSSA